MPSERRDSGQGHGAFVAEGTARTQIVLQILEPLTNEMSQSNPRAAFGKVRKKQQRLADALFGASE